MQAPKRGWTRRDFVKVAATSGAAAVVPGAWTRLGAAVRAGDDVIRIGLVVPETPAGAAAARGAELGAAEASQLAELLGRRFELVTRSAHGSDEERAAADALFEDDGAAAVAGGFDAVSAEALGAVAQAHGRLFLNVGAADVHLRSAECHRNSFHVTAGVGMYADALALWLAGERGRARCVLVTEGSEDDAPAARARQALLARGGEVVAQARFRGTSDAPDALRAIEAANAPAVLVSLRGEPRAEFLERYREAGLTPELACLFPSEMPVWMRPARERIGIWPVLWHPKLFKYGAEQLTDRFERRFGEPPETHAWVAWMAAKILAEGALRARTIEGTALVHFLTGGRAHFDGHKGYSLTFRPWNHELRQPIYLVRAKAQGESVRKAIDHVAELPPGEPAAGTPSADFLDQLGDGPDETPCRFTEA